MTIHRVLVISGVVPSLKVLTAKGGSREVKRRYKGTEELCDIKGRSLAWGELADTGD